MEKKKKWSKFRNEFIMESFQKGLVNKSYACEYELNVMVSKNKDVSWSVIDGNTSINRDGVYSPEQKLHYWNWDVDDRMSQIIYKWLSSLQTSSNPTLWNVLTRFYRTKWVINIFLYLPKSFSTLEVSSTVSLIYTIFFEIRKNCVTNLISVLLVKEKWYTRFIQWT